MLPSRVLFVRVARYLLVMAALVPVAGVFGVPFAYPLLVLAATALVYRREREPMSELGLTPSFARMGLGLLGLLGGAAMVTIRSFTVSCSAACRGSPERHLGPARQQLRPGDGPARRLHRDGASARGWRSGSITART